MPEFVQADHPIFIKFLETYYKHQEQDNEAYNVLTNLSQYRDIDDTTLAVLHRHIKSSMTDDFLSTLTASIDIRKLNKNVIDIYQHKGDEASFRALFRLMTNDEIEFYYPKYDMLRLSDSTYKIYDLIRITNNAVQEAATDLTSPTKASLITGATSGFTAGVNIVTPLVNNIYTFTLDTGGSGIFRAGELVTQTNSSTSTAASGTVFQYAPETSTLVVGNTTGPFNFAPTVGTLGNAIGTDSAASWVINIPTNTVTIEYELELENVSGTFTVGENITASGVTDSNHIEEVVKNIITSATLLSTGDNYIVGDTFPNLGVGIGIPGTITVADVVEKNPEAFVGNGTITVFYLENEGDTAYTEVKVDGTTQTKLTHYKVLGKILTMVVAPASGKLLELRFTDGPLSKIDINDAGLNMPDVTGTFDADDYLVTLVLTSGGSGTYTATETVLQQIDGASYKYGAGRNAKGVVVSWTAGTRTLVLKTIAQKFELLNESGSGNIIGQSSGASYTIDSLTATAELDSTSVFTRILELEVATDSDESNELTLEDEIGGLQYEIDGDDYYNECGLYLTGGTGVGQLRLITDYVASTFLLTLDSQFDITPDATTTFRIVPMINSKGYIVINTTNGATADAGDDIELETATDSNDPNRLVFEQSAEILLNVGSVGSTIGGAVDDQGQLSETSAYIQDSLFYQDFSYRITSGADKSSWISPVKNLVHPAGWEAFGNVLITNDVNSTSSVSSVFEAINDSTSENQYVLKSIITAIGSSGYMFDVIKHDLISAASVYDTIKGRDEAGSAISTFGKADEITIKMSSGGSGTYTVAEGVSQQDSANTYPVPQRARATVVSWDATNRLLVLDTILGRNAFASTTGTVGNIIGDDSAASYKAGFDFTYNTTYLAGKIDFAAPVEVDIIRRWTATVTVGTNFTHEETVTGSSSGATGIVSYWNTTPSPDEISIQGITGTFTAADTITGSTSATQATLDAPVTS